MNTYNNVSTPNELFEFMQKNVTYGYLSKDSKLHHFYDQDFNDDWYNKYILQSAEEVINNKVGNCWDQVELERQWFEENGYIVKTFYEMIKLDYENIYPTHSFLVFKDKENDNWYWFENADFNNRGIHKFDNIDSLLKYQIDKYMELLRTFNIKDIELEHFIITKFEKPKKNSSAEEYINHTMMSDDVKISLQGDKKMV